MTKQLQKLAAVALVAVGSLSLYSCAGSSGSDFDNIDLVPVTLSKDANWSMINDKGEIVYDGEFKNRPSVAYNGYFSVEEGKGYTLYKADSKKPEAVKGLEELVSVGFVEDGLVPVVYPKSRITVVNTSGEKKFELEPVKGVEVVECALSFQEGLLEFTTDEGKHGYYNTSGKVAINADFDTASQFSEGLAVVGRQVKDSTDTTMKYEVIDKKGKTVFKIKDGYSLESFLYSGGYLVAKNEDRIVFFDKKGEVTKMPSKINEVSDYNDKYIIYRNEEDEYGVADFNGEVIIRPKYENMVFNGDDTFFARKKGDEKEVLLLDSKGETVKTLDYEIVIAAGRFGYFAKDGNTISVLDDDFKAKTKDEFYDLRLNYSACYSIRTDYFNTAAVAKTLVAMIGDGKVGDVVLCQTPAQVMKDKEASRFTYTSHSDLESLEKSGFRYKISAEGYFTEPMANYNYDYSTYSSSYSWNPESKLAMVNLNLFCETDWGKEGRKELESALKSAGFKLVKSGETNSIPSAMYKKGNTLVVVICPDEGKDAGLCIGSSKLPGAEEEMLKSVSNGEVTEEVVETVDSAADTVAAVPAVEQ